MKRSLVLPLGFCCIVLAGLLTAAVVAADSSPTPNPDAWYRFRGPNGSGVNLEAKPLPEKWSATENLRWKTELPGPGSSSAIILGKRVYTTCWTGYGADAGTRGGQSSLKRHLLCLSADDGKILWDKAVDAVLPETNYGGQFAEHGYASSTPVTDGERIYVFFGKTGAFAFDLDGNQLWKTSLGTGLNPSNWGSASSPVLYKNLVIFNAAAESKSLIALDKATGKQVWKQSGFGQTWSTPVVVQLKDHAEVVVGIPGKIMAYNADSGEPLWNCKGFNSMNSACGSVIAEGETVYAIEGGPIAVKAGGEGKIDSTEQVIWKGGSGSRIIPTPVLFEERIYHVGNSGLVCTDAKTGKVLYQSRLSGGGGGGGRAGQEYGSPIIADGKLYFVSRGGMAYVIQPGPEFKQLAANRMTTDKEDFSSTPAVADGQLYIRSSANLYCIGTAK